MKRRGWLTKEDAFDVRRKLAIEGNVYLELNHATGRATVVDPPEPESEPPTAFTPVPMRRGKRIDPVQARKARKR